MATPIQNKEIVELAADLFKARKIDSKRVCGDLSGTEEQETEELLKIALKRTGYL